MVEKSFLGLKKKVKRQGIKLWALQAFFPLGGKVASNEWKGGFHWVEALFPMGGNRASDV